MADCRVCFREDSQKPMIFRGTDFCSDDHRKILTGEVQPYEVHQEGSPQAGQVNRVPEISGKIN